MSRKQRVIFPGRGSYSAKELGYVSQYHSTRIDLVSALDARRAEAGAEASLALDGLAKFSPAKHLPGRNASNLIYTCALADFAALNRDKFEVVAVCGNSLGWYLSLAAAGALTLENGAHLVDTMGAMMERDGIGGQLLCSVAGDDWTRDAALREAVLDCVGRTKNAYLSIDLAGTLVLAGDDGALKKLRADLPKLGPIEPVVLPKHAAFHTPLLGGVAERARDVLPRGLFGKPNVPMIDGRGKVWSPNSADVDALHAYTLGQQITQPYDFAKSIEAACKEFAPDKLILMGPGSSLGAPIAQTLIAHNWRGLNDRAEFVEAQASDPFLIAMGREEQRGLAV
jgi:acyl transferase domain-containing protein